MSSQRSDNQPARALNPTAAALLGLLHNGPQAGWDLVAAADLTIGPFWTVTRSQVYRELAALAADGLIVADEVGPRDRRPYALTAAGREAFAAWIVRDPPAEQIRFPLLLTLSFAEHLTNRQLRVIIAEHRVMHAERLAAYLEGRDAFTAEGSAPATLVTIDFGIRYETAVLDWFDNLPDPFHPAPTRRSAGR